MCLHIYQKRVWEGSGDIKRSHKHAQFAQIKMTLFGLKPEENGLTPYWALLVLFSVVPCTHIYSLAVYV